MGFFTINNIKVVFWSILVASLFAAAATIYFLFARIDTLNVELHKTKTELETQIAVNQELNKSVVDIRNSYSVVIKANEENVKALDDLRKKFANDGNGWQHIIQAKPKLVENIINNATAMRLRCLEVATGASLTEDEKNGKTKNTVCPAIIAADKRM